MNEQEQTNDEPLHCWAFIEIMGHSKIAGRVTERKIGPNVMIQVDVPKLDTEFLCTKLFNPASLFSITPTNEEWCRKWAKQVANYDLKPLPYIPEAPRLDVTAASESEPDDDDCDYDDGDPIP